MLEKNEYFGGSDNMKRVLIGMIKFYQFVISPITGPSCRFHPTCSTYMVEAIESRGAIKGSVLGIKRLLKCHPFYKGNFLDPVPTTKPICGAKPIASKGWFGYKRKHSPASNTKK